MYDFYQDFSGGFMNGSMAVTPMEFDSGDVAVASYNKFDTIK
jgi:hypothetical protein